MLDETCVNLLKFSIVQKKLHKCQVKLNKLSQAYIGES